MVSANGKARPTLSISAAAVLMELKPSRAREILTRRHAENPDSGLLIRQTISPRGNYLVDAEALRVMLRSGRGHQAVDELTDRVGLLESDVKIICDKMRLLSNENSRIERIANRRTSR